VIVLVSDTSILIDLERGGLLEAIFACGWTVVVPDLLYDRELAGNAGPYLRSLGLGVVELTPAEMVMAQQVRHSRSALSLPDSFALSCAHRAGHVLVSGDRALRSEAKARGVTVHGLLWLLDRMADAEVPNSTLHHGLSAIATHTRCRLPSEEVAMRLRRWETK
jgi:predicted nucleic acid-binding protein